MIADGMRNGYPPCSESNSLEKSASSALIVVVQDDPAVLIEHIRQLRSDAVIVPIDFESRLSRNQRSTKIPDQVDLTARQLEVLHHVLLGYTNKQIGRILNISAFTVRNHVSKLLRLLNVSTRWQLRALNAGQFCSASTADAAIEGKSSSDWTTPSSSHP